MQVHSIEMLCNLNIQDVHILNEQKRNKFQL